MYNKTTVKNLKVNIVSESDITVQGHGVHTAYDEMATALEKRDDIEVVRGKFGQLVDCDVVHLHTIGPRTFKKLNQRGPKKVVSAHVIPQSLVGSVLLAQYWSFAARWYMRWFYGRADKVLAVSGMVANVLEKELHIPKSRIEVFYNTVDMASYRPTKGAKVAARKKLGIPQGASVVLGNGQVQPRKRLDVFVQMAKDLPDVTFLWVGGIPFKQLGADYAKMNQLMQNLPSNMTITGVIPHDDVLTYLHAADVFCLPAEQENHPMCVLEAAGAELPIVLRDMPEYDDTFMHDAIRCKDDTFVQEITKLLTDKSYYNHWKSQSEHIAQRFDSAQAAKRYVKLYKGLLG